ncbi:MAG: hypothetical protein AAGE52_41010 [Myxococcota bacterium]
MEEGLEQAQTTIDRAVALVQRRLTRRSSRTALRRWAPWIVGASAAFAMLRPLVWPLGEEDPLWWGAPLALAFFGGALLVGLLLAWRGGRRVPSPLRAARAIDRSLTLHEVVASGHALRGEDLGEVRSRARAADALTEFDDKVAFPLPRLVPRFRSALLALVALLLAVTLGMYDPQLAEVWRNPPTDAETTAAAALAEAAEELDALEQPAAETPEPETATEAPSLRRQVSEVARSLQRSDRHRALDALRNLREAAADRRETNRQLDQAARRIARHLQSRSRSPSGESGSTQRQTQTQQSAEESLRLLARRETEREGEAASAEERRRTLERLSRAADEARRAGAEGERLAEALSRAAEALNRNAPSEASERLREAAARAAELGAQREQRRSEAEALARLLERIGATEASVQMAMLGRSNEAQEGQEGMPGGEGEGDERRGLAAELARRLEAMGLAERPAAGGPGQRGPRPGAARAPSVHPSGDLHARSIVREGERAVQVLEGLGQNEEAQQGYSDVYPGYGAIAEEALGSEDIPALRREAVRRYFEAIRPEAFGAEDREESSEGTEE